MSAPPESFRRTAVVPTIQEECVPVESIVSPAIQAAASADVRAAISVLSTVTLVLMLVVHEIAVVVGERLEPLARSTTILLAPLLIVFGVIVVSRWPT